MNLQFEVACLFLKGLTCTNQVARFVNQQIKSSSGDLETVNDEQKKSAGIKLQEYSNCMVHMKQPKGLMEKRIDWSVEAIFTMLELCICIE